MAAIMPARKSKHLTATQRRVLDYLEIGLNDDQIAARLGVENVTIRGHVMRLCQLHAVPDRTALVRELKNRRIHVLESLIDSALDSMGACPCACCDQHYRLLYNGSHES